MPRRLINRGLGGLRAGQGRPLAGAIALLLAGALALPGDGPVPTLRLDLFDTYQSLLPRTRRSGPVQIIAIDEAALKAYGQWPWPRTRLADLITDAAAQRPLAIGLDIMMPEADMTSPEALAARVVSPALSMELLALPANDALLAAAMRRAPVVLGAAGFNHPAPSTSAALRVWPLREQGGAALNHVRRYPQALASLSLMQAAASGQGLLSADLEKGIVRRAPLVAAIGDSLLPSLAMELLRVATGAEALEVTLDAHGVAAVSVGDLHVPTLSDGSVWVNFSAPAPARYVSALDLMEGRLEPGALENKIVIVALTGLGLMDYKTNARGDFLPGVDVHAQLIESFFDGSFLRRPDWMRWAELACFGVLALALIAAMPRLRLAWSLMLAAGMCAGVGGAGAALFMRGWLFDAAAVLAALTAVGLSLLASMLAAAVRARKRSDRALQLARESAAKAAGELGAAHRIQMASLPVAASAFPGELRFSLDALLEPAREVGGDLYDFFMLDRDRVFFMIGDVSGKGLPASLFMVVAKALSKSIALRGAADMAVFMKHANRELVRENPEMLFVTSVAGILDASSGEVLLCNAGHDAPRRLRVDGGVERLQAADGPPLCVMDDFDYPVQRYLLQAGECLCLSTDGITEAMDAHGQLYGNERLDLLLASQARLPGAADGQFRTGAIAAPAVDEALGAAGASIPSAVVSAVREDVRRHVGAAAPSDDLTLLVLRWNGASAEKA
ncbi:CHASE2 domain-containing protein [Oxalobacteraceae bacterium]|nr:CHASE2 domain-containing protein [Oxalobacteraceae bacterium]